MSEMISVPSRPPHEDGQWHADDLNRYDFPDHTQILEGQLAMMMSPQRSWHADVVDETKRQLKEQLRKTYIVQREMSVLIDDHNVPEPDVVVVAPRDEYGPDTTRYRVEDVALVVEVESPATWRDDRNRKKDLYAKAGIGDYLLIGEDADGVLQFDWYRLDGEAYRLAKRGTEELHLGEPWGLRINLRHL